MLPTKQIGPNRLFTDKDLAGFYYVTQLLAKQDKDKNFLYVGLGRSPAVLMEFMRQAFELPTLDLPLGGMSSGGEVNLSEDVLKFLQSFLPPDKIKGKTLVLVDYAYSGKSLKLAQSLVQSYIEKLGKSENTVVRIAPITHKSTLLEDSLLQNFDVETRAAHRLIKVLFTELDKEFYSPYVSVKYAQLARDSVIPQNIEQIRERKALEEMMKLALTYYTSQADISALESSPYMKKRTHQKKPKFSYAGFGFGYNPVDEEAWVTGLHQKAAAYYKVDRQIVIPTHLTQKATEYRRKIQRQQLIRTCKTYGPRIVNLAFVLLLIWAAWYVYKLFAPNTGSTKEL